MNADKIKNRCINLSRPHVKDPEEFEAFRRTFNLWWTKALRANRIQGAILKAFYSDVKKSNEKGTTTKEA